LPPAQYAFLLALLSGLSLPVGAMLGVRLKPSDTTIAQWIAIGAGALLFAVSVELYGHSIHGYAAGHIELVPMIILFVMSLVGSFSYTYLTRLWGDDEDSESGDEEAHVRKAASGASGGSPEVAGEASLESPFNTPRRSTDRGRGAAHYLAHGRGIGNLIRQVEMNRRWKAQRRWAHLREAMKKYHIVRFMQLQVEKSRRVSFASSACGRNTFETSKAQFWENMKRAWADTGGSGPDPEELTEIMKSSRAASISMLIMLLVDGVPEGILMGLLSASGILGFAFVLSLVIANFPEGFAGGQLMEQAGYSTLLILAAWSVPMLLTATGAATACHMLLWLNPTFAGGSTHPFNIQVLVAATEGVAGGAMISGIAACMLPEAYERRDKKGGILQSGGFLCTFGFLLAFGIKTALN
jgi:zinc transporter ZupT